MAASLLETIKAADGSAPFVTPIKISLAQIRNGETTGKKLLETAASTSGFFYLELRGDTLGERLLENLPIVYEAAARYFAQLPELKANDVRHDLKPSQDIGYKKRRTGEDFDISRDELASLGVSSLPPRLKEQGEQIIEFSTSCDEACLMLLNSLSTDFVSHHRVDQPSETGLKLTLEPSLARLSDGGDNLHTDGGTLTMLFYEELGLHAYFRDEDKWGFVPIMEGCVVMNVADSLERLSAGMLHSPKHRVTQPVDGAKDRYFLSYFLRPENALKEIWAAEE